MKDLISPKLLYIFISITILQTNLGKSEESETVADWEFPHMDKNSDNLASKEEVSNWEQKHVSLQFTALDTNKDGTVTREEVRQGIADSAIVDRIMETFDSDADGQITLEEFFTIIDRGIYSGFDLFDENKDGNLDMEEWKAAKYDTTQRNRKYFNLFDLNGDGFIDWDENKAFFGEHEVTTESEEEAYKESWFERNSKGDGKLSFEDVVKLGW